MLGMVSVCSRVRWIDRQWAVLHINHAYVTMTIAFAMLVFNFL